jgi:hypothetical protein
MPKVKTLIFGGLHTLDKFRRSTRESLVQEKKQQKEFVLGFSF